MDKHSKSQVDFSKGRFRDMLVWQRKLMWTDEAIERIARWTGLNPGQSVVDVGCGLGYLGYTFWPYFGNGGRYTGIDIREGLIRDASEAAFEWSAGGMAKFILGDAYDLPVADSSADIVMCQTLMIHLEFPEKAISEMIRILKPGGRILCIEPDNFHSSLTPGYTSLPEQELDVMLHMYKINYLAHKGRIKLGRGDDGIAPKIPHILTRAGFDIIEVRVRDDVPYLEPPYGSGRQHEKIENMKKHWINEDSYRARLEEQREEFLAGGGDAADFDRVLKIGSRLREMQLEQIENSEFYMCYAYPIYLIKGTKNQTL